jgi:hypothetical protein
VIGDCRIPPKRQNRRLDGAPGTRRKPGFCLEAYASAELDFAARRGYLGDAAEARGVHEAVWRTEIGVVERVEELRACFEAGLLCNAELAHDPRIEGLQTGSVDHVSAGVAVGVGGRCCERLGIDPGRGVPRAGSEDLLSRKIRANRVFAHNRACICGISEDGDGEGETGLSLEFERRAPVAAERLQQAIGSDCVGAAKRWRMSQPGPFSASRSSLFCGVAASNIGERKSGAFSSDLAKV